jgi:UDP-N-acetylmuramyl pentapeptide phosphotransferase/UDP-N-acetylglucosamine-1-phosphate transferase
VEWLHGHPLVIAVAIVAVVALLNAVNFLDAMAGIVGTLLPIIGAGFVALAVLYHAPIATALGWSLVGACAGFLVYNAPPARIFLGDAGSHLLGFGLATLALQALRDEPTLPHLASVGILLAYPLFDVAFVVKDRTARRKPIYVGGVDHDTPVEPSVGCVADTRTARVPQRSPCCPGFMGLGPLRTANRDSACPHFWAWIRHFRRLPETFESHP